MTNFKKAVEQEIMLLRENAKRLDFESMETMTMSEWPLCMAALGDCSDCPVMFHTGVANCNDNPLGHLSWFWSLRKSGAIEQPAFAKKLNKAADWLENEVMPESVE